MQELGTAKIITFGNLLHNRQRKRLKIKKFKQIMETKEMKTNLFGKRKYPLELKY